MKGNETRVAVGSLCGIAYRSTKREAMCEVGTCEVLLQRGLAIENRPAGKREVTLMSKEAWQRVCAELGRDLPWSTRRANLLIEGVDLARSIGKTISVGAVRIEIHDETRPCALMDKLHEGLRTALVPEGRGGVFGQVATAGTISVGDSVVVSD